MAENVKAAEWRVRINLSQAELADRLGWTRQCISMFERGVNSSGEPVSEWAWQRYKLACAGLQREIESRKEFNW